MLLVARPVEAQADQFRGLSPAGTLQDKGAACGLSLLCLRSRPILDSPLEATPTLDRSEKQASLLTVPQFKVNALAQQPIERLGTS